MHSSDFLCHTRKIRWVKTEWKRKCNDYSHVVTPAHEDGTRASNISISKRVFTSFIFSVFLRTVFQPYSYLHGRQLMNISTKCLLLLATPHPEFLYWCFADFGIFLLFGYPEEVSYMIEGIFWLFFFFQPLRLDGDPYLTKCSCDSSMWREIGELYRYLYACAFSERRRFLFFAIAWSFIVSQHFLVTAAITGFCKGRRFYTTVAQA